MQTCSGAGIQADMQLSMQDFSIRSELYSLQIILNRKKHPKIRKFFYYNFFIGQWEVPENDKIILNDNDLVNRA